MDIVFTTNGTHTLVNVDIVNPILMDLVSQVASSRGVVAMIVVHAKVVLYPNQHLQDNFTLLAIEIFECLH
jgi:hypothetical protein